MSKNFEEEYKEYLDAQAPDIWKRIEDGIDAQEVKAGRKKKAKRKRSVRYQRYRVLVSVAAALLALLIIVPVYMLTKPAGKSMQSEDSANSPALTDIEIQNIEVEQNETAMPPELAQVTEDSASRPAEIPVSEEQPSEMVTELVPVQETTSYTDEGKTTGDFPDAGTVAEAPGVASEGEEGIGLEESGPEEEMQVTILEDGIVQEDGVLFSAAVSGSASSATVSLLVPAGSDIQLETGKSYTLLLQSMEDGIYYRVLAATAVP